jgi:hypothetical protein
MSKIEYENYMDKRIFKSLGQEAAAFSAFIITISATVKVTQNTPLKLYLPLIETMIVLERLDITMQ